MGRRQLTGHWLIKMANRQQRQCNNEQQQRFSSNNSQLTCKFMHHLGPGKRKTAQKPKPDPNPNHDPKTKRSNYAEYMQPRHRYSYS